MIVARYVQYALFSEEKCSTWKVGDKEDEPAHGKERGRCLGGESRRLYGEDAHAGRDEQPFCYEKQWNLLENEQM